MAGSSVSADLSDSRLAVPIVLTFALLVRLAIGLHSYSGVGVSPTYGDYEAQRHWMEITLHTPITEWYTNTSTNDLTYWGLDYPPLSAYQSWAVGAVIHRVEPAAVALMTSRGYETPSSKLLMRWSVIIFDLLVFFPAVLACAAVFWGGQRAPERMWLLLMTLLQPAAVLIDHGHFQYNNINLGLTAGAAAAVASGRHLLGSALFCAALNHKQMAMYYAPAFFAHLLGTCLQRPTLGGKAWGVARLGLVVVASFSLLWAPFLWPPKLAVQVLQRLVPVRRGLYEDYVANFWCATALVVKWKRLFTQEALVRMCAGATLAAVAPSMLHQMRSPSNGGLLLAMANSAFAFFLFSYQVHEKSILLPLLPVTLLAADEPALASWMPALAAFSMYPLLKKDGLPIAYLGTLLMWAAIAWPGNPPTPHPRSKPGGKAQRGKGRKQGAGTGVRGSTGFWWGFAMVLVAGGIHVADVVWTPLERYPFLLDYMFVTLGFVHFAGAAVYLNWRQWQLVSVACVKED